MDNVISIKSFLEQKQSDRHLQEIGKNNHNLSHQKIKEVMKVVEEWHPQLQAKRMDSERAFGKSSQEYQLYFSIEQSSLFNYGKLLEINTLFNQLDPEYYSSILYGKLSNLDFAQICSDLDALSINSKFLNNYEDVMWESFLNSKKALAIYSKH